MKLFQSRGKRILTLFVLCSVIAGTTPASALAGSDSPDSVEYAPEEIIVKFKPGVSSEKIASINSKHGTSVVYTSPHAGITKLHIPKGKTVPEMVEIYSNNPNVEYAEPDYIAHALMVPNDPLYRYQWHLDNTEYGGINMEKAWDISTGTGVTVAVIDTGVAYEDYREFVDNIGPWDYWVTYAQAPDLEATNFVAGYDFVNDDSHPNDDEGHGTHVTGTIAQSTNNGMGTSGVAFDCSIMPVKVLDGSGSGYYSWIADGIYYAADNGAQVISMSLGGTAGSTVLEEALAYAYGKGVTIVCAAGNGGPTGLPNYPAAYDAYCIAVSATRYDETISYYSNIGDYVDIAAPGGDTNVDQNEDGYVDGVLQQTHNGRDYTKFGYYFYQGTSMATPHVSGVAALLIANGVTDPDDVREALESTAEDKGEPELDREYGWGIVDAYAALQWSATPNEPPVAWDQSVTTDEDTEYPITLNATDSDGDALTYSIVSVPLHGELTGTLPYVTYMPDVDYNGADNFTFLANDGKADSNTATVSITVNPVNDQPVADSQSVTTEENTPVNVILTGSDVDGDAFTFIEVTDPSNGTLVKDADFSTNGNLIYTPAIGFIGDDSFTFKISDGILSSELATVSITVTETNAPPVANADGPYTGTEGVAITFDGSGSYDPNSDPITYAWDFGDGNTGTGVSPVHTYNADGAYTVTLIVNDSIVDSISDTTTAIVSDTDPDASFTSDSPKTEGEVMAFTDTSASYDGIITWNWDFGDEETSSDQNPTHVYGSAGTYPVTLTVEEADGDTDSYTSDVMVTEVSTPSMHVASIDMSTTMVRLNGWYTYATALVTIVDADGNPVQGAVVSGEWSGVITDTHYGITGTDGTTGLVSIAVKNAVGTFTFTVTDVTRAGWTYDESANVESSDSITV